MNQFWRGHPATPNQQQLPFDGTRKRRKPVTQAEVLIGLLRDRCARKTALELPDIMRAGIAQHGVRFKEIRERGFVVRNEMERTADGIHSRYWLEHDPEADG
jgi:hypothetical protein